MASRFLIQNMKSYGNNYPGTSPHLHSGIFFPTGAFEPGKSGYVLGELTGVDVSRASPTATENRPINMAVKHLIKAIKYFKTLCVNLFMRLMQSCFI